MGNVGEAWFIKYDRSDAENRRTKRLDAGCGAVPSEAAVRNLASGDTVAAKLIDPFPEEEPVHCDKLPPSLNRRLRHGDLERTTDSNEFGISNARFFRSINGYENDQ